MSYLVAFLSLLILPGLYSAPSTLDPFDSCYLGCQCYNLTADHGPKAEPTASSQLGVVSPTKARFAVNCQQSDINWFYQYEIDFIDLVQKLPSNTTDLVVSDFSSPLQLGVVMFELFQPLLLNLTIDSCKQLTVHSNAFQSRLFLSIEAITLENNWMSSGEIQKGTFELLINVETITVVGNMLMEVVQKEAFRTLPKLRIANLSRNWLKDIHEGSFVNTPNLTTLDLSGKFLSHIPGDGILDLARTSLKHLFLARNRWNCSCEMEWILALDKTLLADINPAVCLYPSHLNGTALNLLTEEHFKQCCPHSSGVLYFHTTSIAVCLVLFCLAAASFPLFMIVLDYYRSRQIVQIGPIFYDKTSPLAPGKTIYRGWINDGRQAAVKELPKLLTKRPKELEALLKMESPHDNVIHYFMTQDKKGFTYIALELCEGNLKEIMDTALSDQGDRTLLSQLTAENCLLPLAHGLRYIHDVCKLQHRDIKPSNVLWKPDELGRIKFLLSDFDLSHYAEDQSSHNVKCGTEGWSAPELWERGSRSFSVDIFSLGCLFYYVFARGHHPFESQDNTNSQDNITTGQSSLAALVEHLDQFNASLAEDLIESMIQTSAKDRLKAQEVCDHPLFWSMTRQVQFYHDIGNCMKKGQESKGFMTKLEQGKGIVFEGSWMGNLETCVRNDLSGFKKRSQELCALLQVIRNKMEHAANFGPELKAVYNGTPEGVVQYYNTTFPKLLVYTNKTWQHQYLLNKN